MANRFRTQRKIGWKHWTGFTGGATGFAAGTIGVMLAAAQHEPETILRTRGQLLAYVDGTQAPGGLTSVGMGMAIVPEGTGTTVLWSPITDADAPWFWYTRFHLGYEEMVTDVVDVPAVSGYREAIDSKAMRKGPQSTEVQLVIESVTALTAVAINLLISGRFLTGHA